MDLELDHVILFTAPGAPVVDRLVEAGFREGSRNTHPGQGTANRRVFFVNAFLEFLYVTDAAALQSPTIAPTALAARFAGGCPLGLVLRPRYPGAPIPFPTWSFRPPYLPDGVDIAVATTTPDQPFVAVIGFGGRPEAMPPERAEPLRHPAGAAAVRHVVLCGPRIGGPSAVLAGAAAPVIGVEQDVRWTTEVTLDVPGTGRLDLRPDAPLVLHWGIGGARRPGSTVGR
jgi:Glyoxalase-like domain